EGAGQALGCGRQGRGGRPPRRTGRWSRHRRNAAAYPRHRAAARSPAERKTTPEEPLTTGGRVMREPRGFRRRPHRLLAAAAAAAVSAGLVAGCSSESQVPSIGFAVDAAVASYNGGSTLGASTGATAVFGRVLTGFFYTGPDGQQVADTDVGTAKEVPGESQTIQYRLNPDGVYSDGVPTSCDDLVLAWAARSGRFTRPGDVGPVPLFDAASTAGYEDIERIECLPGSKDATVVFRPDRRYLPWRNLFTAGELMPAHIAAQAANVPNVVSAMQSGDPSAIQRLADFWNSGWTLTPGELD